MFDGVPDQFHHFLASRTSLPLPLSFPSVHSGAAAATAAATAFPSFEPYPSHQTLHSHLLTPLHHQSTTQKDEEKEEICLLSTNLEFERERLVSEPVDPWSNDEVLALLRIRSSMENWLPEITWEHVSRKLGELGFKRSAEKCKEKFEEESRHFNCVNYSKNYRFFSELEELYHGDQNPHQVLAEKNQKMEKQLSEEEDKVGQNLEEDFRNETVLRIPDVENNDIVAKLKSKKRKRNRKFEMLKGFCEDVVKMMMAQQEEMHNKLLEDMLKRDEEKHAREEIWKKQEMYRINKEIEMRAHEQAIAGNRQSTIIELLKKFTNTSSEKRYFGGRNEDFLMVPKSSNASTSSCSILAQDPSPTSQLETQTKLEAATSSTMVLAHQNTSSFTTQNDPNIPTSSAEPSAPQNPSFGLATKIPRVPTSSTSLLPASLNPNSLHIQNDSSPPTSYPTHKPPQNPNVLCGDTEDHGKRWPRDEVLALINLRCSLFGSGEDTKELGAKAPLWERVSQKMQELGYKRSAKRCKEKWENINKYFRKTKDANKKRSLDSRTCPYFHQLSTLYSQGKLVGPSEELENRSTSMENHSLLPETRQGSSSQGGSSTDADVHVAQGEKKMAVVPGFGFDF